MTVLVADKELSTMTNTLKEVFTPEQLILTDQKIKLWAYFRGYKNQTDRFLLISAL